MTLLIQQCAAPTEVTILKKRILKDQRQIDNESTEKTIFSCLFLEFKNTMINKTNSRSAPKINPALISIIYTSNGKMFYSSVIC
jgi:hypothetical protein